DTRLAAPYRPDQVGVPARRGLRDSSLRRIVHIDKSKAMGIARAPFEVVEQGPHEVAAHVGAGGDGRTQGSHVEGEITAALQVAEVARAVELLDGACAVF